MTIRRPSNIVFRSAVQLAEYVRAGGATQLIKFSKEILWFPRSETTHEFWHGECLLKTCSTFVDVFSFLESGDQYSQSNSLANHFKIDKKSTLELQCRTRIYLEPALEVAVTLQQLAFDEIPSKWVCITRTPYGRPTPLGRILIEDAVTWSSNFSEMENINVLEQFKTTWKNLSCINVEERVAAYLNRKQHEEEGSPC